TVLDNTMLKMRQHYHHPYSDLSPIDIQIESLSVKTRKIDDQSLSDCTSRQTGAGAAWSYRNASIGRRPNSGARLFCAPWKRDSNWFDLVDGRIGGVELAGQIIKPRLTAARLDCCSLRRTHSLSVN